jgi:hypothetical protein
LYNVLCCRRLFIKDCKKQLASIIFFLLKIVLKHGIPERKPDCVGAFLMSPPCYTKPNYSWMVLNGSEKIKTTVFPLILPTLIFNAYPKVFIDIFG